MCEQIDDTETKHRCLNCGAELRDEYCSSCGQSADTTQLRFGPMVKEVFAGLVDFDKPLYRTLIGLTIHPGKLISDYVDGKRQHYTNPIKYSLSASAILILMIQFRGTIVEAAKEFAIPEMSTHKQYNEFLNEFFTQFYQLVERMAPYTHIETLLMMPVLAFLLSLFFKKSKHTVADHFAFGCYIFGHISLVIAILLAFNLHNLIIESVLLIELLYPFIYLTWGAIVFNKNRFIPGLLRSTGTYILYLLFAQLVYITVILVKMLIV